jgi:outer membrane protein OmpA-like peptidoglycan-associated protein
VAKPADDHLVIPLHVQGVILGEFVSRQTGGELGASYTVIPHLDLGATAVLGSNIGIRATGMLHPVRGADIQPFVQLRAIVNPVSGGLGAGGGAWGGASMELGPGRALVGLMGEAYHGPSSFYPYAILAAAGYEFDPFRPVQQVVQIISVNSAPPPPPAPTEAIFKGRVTDLDDKPLQGSLRFTGVGPELSKPYDASPSFEVHLPPGEYHAEASAPGYLTRGRTFTVHAGETLVYDFQLRPESKQQVVIIRNDRLEITQQILFEFNKSRILPFSFFILDEVVDTLFKHPEIKKVRIEGHTDDVGGAEFNQKLSEARAKSVMEYLVDKGVDPGRLSAVGYGLTKPIATNKTDEGRAKNRRVQFTIEERSEPAPVNTQ